MGACDDDAAAFLAAASVTAMQGRWIPDEEWVRYIQTTRKEAKITTMNKGIAARWPIFLSVHHLTTEVRVVCNKYYIQQHKHDEKEKPKKTTVSFYFVLSKKNDQIPAIPKQADFWQEIWDSRSSNRSLKRVLPKAKQYDKTECVSPFQQSTEQTINERRSITPTCDNPSLTTLRRYQQPISNIEQPRDFTTAFGMLQQSWKEKYPDLPFPFDHVAFFPVHRANEMMMGLEKTSSSSTISQQLPNHETRTTKYNTSKYCLVTHTDLSRYKKERHVVRAMKKVCLRRQSKTTQTMRNLFAGFAAIRPQISPYWQEHLIAIARYSIMAEVQDFCQRNAIGGEIYNFSWLTLENIANSSPSKTTINRWVQDLAVSNLLIFGRIAERSQSLGVQSDGGHKGQEIRLLTVFDELDKSAKPDGSVIDFLVDTTSNGKKSDEVAYGTKVALSRLGIPAGRKLNNNTADSGAGTPESQAESLSKLNLWHERGIPDSCGLHDLQSCFRLPIQNFIGSGGMIDNQPKGNAIQACHTTWAFWDSYKQEWPELVRKTWEKAQGTEKMPASLHGELNVPPDLFKAMLQPLITRWWTIGSIACFLRKYCGFIELLADSVRKRHSSKDKEYTIASNLCSLLTNEWIRADIYFLAGIAEYWLNPHMKWYQGSDPNIGKAGFLSYHRLVRYFLMIRDLEHLLIHWESEQAFKTFKDHVEAISDSNHKHLKKDMLSLFIKKMISQVHKHNQRYLLTHSVVRAVYSEKQTGMVVAKVLRIPRATMDQVHTQSESFFSKIHDRSVDLVDFHAFIANRLDRSSSITLQHHPTLLFHKNNINMIATGVVDVWNGDDPSSCMIRKFALREFANMASTQHNNERNVKVGANAASTGKQEINVNCFAIAGNGFNTEYHHDPRSGIDPSKNNDDQEDNGQEEGEDLDDNDTDGDNTHDNDVSDDDDDETVDNAPKRRKRGHYRGPQKLLHMFEVVVQVESSLDLAKQTLGNDEYIQRRIQIKEDLLSKSKNIKVQRAKAAVEAVMEAFDQEREPNARMVRNYIDMPPRLFGYYKYRPMSLNANVTYLEQELEARGVQIDDSTKKMTVTKKLDKLKKDEIERFEKAVDEQLKARGLVGGQLKLNGKILLVKQDIEDKEEEMIPWLDVDPKNHFRKMASSVPDSIFDDS